MTQVISGDGAGSGVHVEMRVHDVWEFEAGLLRRRQTFYELEAARQAAGLA